MPAVDSTRLRIPDDALPEVVLVPRGDNRIAQRIARLTKQGRLRPLYRGVYSSNLRSDDEDVVRRNWSAIVGYLAAGAVLSFRSAFDAMPHADAIYVSRTAGAREFVLPGLTVTAFVRAARGPLVDTQKPGARDAPYGTLFIASQARAFLENLMRDKRLADRQLPAEALERRLEHTLALRGPATLSSLRDAAREVAAHLDMATELERLDQLIGALLGTRPAGRLKTAQALARAQGRPYDAERIALFETMAARLREFPFADVAEPARQGRARDMFAFVESYFSNYIEGTTFTLEEADQIVFAGRIIPARDEDSLDILGTFEAAQRDPYYSQVPISEDGFIDWLRAAHALVMRARPRATPGQWKLQPHQAGSTLFVLPELVEATLRRAWPLLATLDHPMAKALFAMFVVSEVHPFTDGNGRASRLIMNAYLSHGAQCRIIVPTIYRDNFLIALKQATHQRDVSAYIRAMRLCQAWSSQLDYDLDMAGMTRQLQATHAVDTDTRIQQLLSPVTGQVMTVPD